MWHDKHAFFFSFRLEMMVISKPCVCTSNKKQVNRIGRDLIAHISYINLFSFCYCLHFLSYINLISSWLVCVARTMPGSFYSNLLRNAPPKLSQSIPNSRSTITCLLCRWFSSTDGTKGEVSNGEVSALDDDLFVHKSKSSFADPPNPIPNRPLRPKRNQFHGTGNHQSSDNSFLEKFKLADQRKRDNLSEIPRQQEKEQETRVKEPLPADADVIFKQMKEGGLIPSAVAMLDGLCKDGLVQEAMNLFSLMREKGTIPEVVIYTAVVEGFCKAFKFDDAKRIFRKMQSKGITPNAFSYNVLIQGLCKGRSWDDAAEFCTEMCEAGHSPNMATLVGLVDGYCREKGFEEAHSVVLRLRQKGFFVEEKAVKQYWDKRGPFSEKVWEAIFSRSPEKKDSKFQR